MTCAVGILEIRFFEKGMKARTEFPAHGFPLRGFESQERLHHGRLSCFGYVSGLKEDMKSKEVAGCELI